MTTNGSLTVLIADSAAADSTLSGNQKSNLVNLLFFGGGVVGRRRL
jgi:hypothetical protein